jgi:hypothetical protein
MTLSNAPAKLAAPGYLSITVNDFIHTDIHSLRTADGKKLGWVKRMGVKMAQKNLEKQVRKGKLEGTASLENAMRASSANKRGLLSVIFGALGIIFLFIPSISIIGLAFSIAGFVLGIIGLSRDEDFTLALIGTILGGVVLVIYLIAILFIAAFAF